MMLEPALETLQFYSSNPEDQDDDDESIPPIPRSTLVLSIPLEVKC